ncbi:hypothetical protein BCR44DRAFT_39524, partial [Catenaria anguillulae PL171]
MASNWTSLDSLEEWDARPWNGRNFDKHSFALLPLSMAQGLATLVLNLLVILAAIRNGIYRNPSHVLILALSCVHLNVEPFLVNPGLT